MKRAFSLILAMILVFSLCACGGSQPEQTEASGAGVFSAGFGMADITPTRSLFLWPATAILTIAYPTALWTIYRLGYWL